MRFRLGGVFVPLLRVFMCAHGLAVRSKMRSISFVRLSLSPCVAAFVGILVAPSFSHFGNKRFLIFFVAVRLHFGLPVVRCIF